jgi:hypothetical protein
MTNKIKIILIVLITILLIIFQVINRRNNKIEQEDIISTPTLSPIKKINYENNKELEIIPTQNNDDLLIENPPYDEFGERTDGGWTEDIDFSLPE